MTFTFLVLVRPMLLSQLGLLPLELCQRLVGGLLLLGDGGSLGSKVSVENLGNAFPAEVGCRKPINTKRDGVWK